MSHDEAIHEAENAVRGARKSLDLVRPDFVSEAGRWLGEWWEKHVATIVRKEHARTTELGKDELGRMKADLHEHVTSAEAEIEQALVKESAWPPSNSHGRHLTDPLDKALRRVMGQIAPVLAARGYVDDSFERKGGNWRYRFAYDISEETRDVLERGAHAAAEVRGAESRLHEAEQAKARDAAADMWEGA